MKKLFILFALLLNIAIGYAQNKIDFTWLNFVICYGSMYSKLSRV